MNTGRPTKYDKHKIGEVNSYLKNHASLGDPVPTIEGLACELDVGRQTLYRWADAHEEFRDILEKVKSHQCRKLIAGGLDNTFNSPFAKMMMAKHGYSDRIEQDITSSDGSMKPTVIELVGVPATHDE